MVLNVTFEQFKAENVRNILVLRYKNEFLRINMTKFEIFCLISVSCDSERIVSIFSFAGVGAAFKRQ